MNREDIVYESAGAHNPEDYVLLKSEADAVMDGYEARIKHLEAILDLDPRTNLSLVNENQQLRDRIKELESDNARLKAQVPKWISVKDRLPENGEYILFVFENCMFFGYYNKDCEFHWCYHTGAMNGATHWMQLPPPPTTEESEKEDG